MSKKRYGQWLQNHPHILEKAYDLMHRLVEVGRPVIEWMGYERFDALIGGAEERGKKAIFDCHMCGQCVLHSTGMTCPMTCPKNLRNGPCGGVRANGNCEVKPEMKCVWVEAFERSQQMPRYGEEFMDLQPPVNRQLEGKSAWLTMLTGEDKKTPPGWVDVDAIPVVDGRVNGTY